MLDVAKALPESKGLTPNVLAAPRFVSHRVHNRARQEGLMRPKVLALFALICLAVFVGCNSRPNVSGVWRGSIQASEKGGKNSWQGPAELTLNQNGDAITGTLSFTHPQGGRVQIPITSGVVSKDAVTFSGQNQFPMGTLELTFHGRVSGASLTGSADMTSRSLLIGPVVNTASLNLTKQ
jgi:hypothetical protein